MTDTHLPARLAEVREEFLELPQEDRLELLLEYSSELPPVPEHLAGNVDMYERVAECQSPVFINVEVTDGVVAMHATAPVEAPTTRGFASILAQGITGLTADEVLAIPATTRRPSD